MNTRIKVKEKEKNEGIPSTKGTDHVRFTWEDYRGEGDSEGLSRGILVFSDEMNMTGEGMGIGSIAVKKKGHTYFSARNATREVENGIIEKTFYLDTWRAWAQNGRTSPCLTRFMEYAANLYMAIPSLQSLLFLRSPLYGTLSIHPVLEQIPPVARARFRYGFTHGRIDVSCTIQSCDGDLPRVFLLNELGGDIFCRSVRNGSPAPPPSGWRAYTDHSSVLCSQHRDICFRLSDVVVGCNASFRLFWGRERTDSLRWAGFEIMIDPCNGTKEVSCSYVVHIGQCMDGDGI